MSESFVARNRLWTRLNAAVAGLAEPPQTPIAVVDLDTFDANAADLVRRAGGKPVRVASKSLRVPALVRRALEHDEPLLLGVLVVVGTDALTGRELVDAGAQHDGADRRPEAGYRRLVALGIAVVGLELERVEVDLLHAPD